MDSHRKRILVFCDYYLPSVGAGGGVRILANIISSFSHKYDFYVVTNDHDSKRDRRPFSNVKFDEWTTYNGTAVYYYSAGSLPETKILELIDGITPDLVLINSLFSYAPARFLWLRRKPSIKEIPFVVLPCGELLAAALKQRRLKKKAFLTIFRLRGLFDSAVWRASSEEEKQGIFDSVDRRADVVISPDLTPVDLGAGLEKIEKPIKEKGRVIFSFVGRIIEHKNLLFFLKAMRNVHSGDIHINLIGPKENDSYWKRCAAEISQLSGNITVESTEVLPHDQVLKVLRESHFMVLPSRSENFGYVIIESLAVGTPVLISDRTPWDLEGRNVGAVLPLEDPEKWVETVERIVEMDQQEYDQWSAAAKEYAVHWLETQPGIDGMEQTFARAFSKADRYE